MKFQENNRIAQLFKVALDERPYPEFANPHVPESDFLELGSDATNDEMEFLIFNKFSEAIPENLRRLFSHFGIDESEPFAWQLLAIALAVKHVRGFDIARTRQAKGGRHITWNAIQRVALYGYVEMRRRKTKKTIRQICGSIPVELKKILPDCIAASYATEYYRTKKMRSLWATKKSTGKNLEMTGSQRFWTAY